MKFAIVIPARMASTRFPGKPLCDLMGKPMIQWVFEAAVESNIAESIWIATPDAEIISVAERFGANAILTRMDHPSGTDRIAEAAERIQADVYINVQGDEPLIDPATISSCAEPFSMDSTVRMTSVWSPCPEEESQNPAVVKVVTDEKGNALYFSRAAIPFERNPSIEPRKKHIGIYGYRHDVLMEFATWQMSTLESSESLEQLRFLEHGVTIRMVEGKGSDMAVDTPEQAELVRTALASKLSP